MANKLVTAYPYARQSGEINVPDEIKDDEEACEEYIREHWNDIKFDEVSLDYKGTDFDVEDDD